MSAFMRLLFILALSLPALAQAAYSAINPKFASLAQNERPKKVLLLPPQMFVAELSAGGVIQKQDDWTKAASENLLVAVENFLRGNGQFETLRLPVLDNVAAEQVESHIALYDRISYAIYIYGRGDNSGWQQKKTEWDYTLGEGLAFLRVKTGADTALLFTGYDIISSSSRKVATVAISLLRRAVIPLGESFISVGLVDLRTGEIRWMSFDQSMTLDSRDPETAKQLVEDFFETYPQQ
jgi:hypothetical protein